ncbi:hypothetical protein ACP70R_030026 [Stipagrostis hirtigluma subsp. patula]
MISFVIFAAVVLHLGAAGEPASHADHWSMLPASSPMPEAIVQLVQRGMTSRVDQYSYEPSSRRRSCVYDGAGRCSDRSSTPMLFFHEEAVQKGSTLPVYFAPAVTANLGFLRRRVAQTIPFKASKLADILAMFHIPPSSSEAADVAATLALCDAAAEGGMVCVTSPEDLVERAVALLGTRRRIAALASVVPSGGVSLQPYAVLAVRPIGGGSSSDFVVCHPELYPYSVHVQLPRVGPGKRLRRGHGELLRERRRGEHGRGVPP